MKRSKSLSLLLMGSLAFGGSGCGAEKAEESMYTFTSLEECSASGLFSESECRELAKTALADAPRFSSREECESQFGEGVCSGAPQGSETAATGQDGGTEVRPHSGSYWMPMMMGFMAGRFLGGGGMMQGSQGLYRDPGAQPGQRSFRTSTGDTVRPDARGRIANPSPRLTQSMTHNAKPVSGRSGTGTRGGFFGGQTGGGS